ncbi:MAG: cysteine desulfurase [Armatimonadetes bacterium]|nr:cysteine desulfurase [Armatimonadota bacterium]
MIYLDNHATTPVDPQVLAAMVPWFTEQFGNPASHTHRYGWAANDAVNQARQQIAQAIGAEPMEVVFTSGATESDNLAIKGVAQAYSGLGNHIITAATEHNAVLDSCRYLEQQGAAITYLPVDAEGFINLDQLQSAFTDRTVLVSIMHGNNETGTMQPIRQIGAICRQRRVLFHTDATQTLGKIPFNVDELNVDLASFSAHKLYGPKGCGALFVRRRKPRVHLAPQLHGGGHERGFRSGTLNVPGIVGFAEAVRIATNQIATEHAATQRLRDILLSLLSNQIPGLRVNGPDPRIHPELRLPGNLNLSFPTIEAAALIGAARGVAFSTGSACSSEKPEPSHVLQAMGLTAQKLRSSVRFGIGRFNTEQQIVEAARILIAATPPHPIA